MQAGVQLSKTANSLSPRAPGNAQPSSLPVAPIAVPIPSSPAPNVNAGLSLVEEEPEAKQPEAPRAEGTTVVRISRRQLWVGASAICVLGLLLAGGLYIRSAGRRQDVTVALTAKRTAEGLEVRWDRHAAVFTPQGALLMIREGDLQKDLYLDLAQLRTGHVLYTPQSNEDLHLRMEVFAATEKAATQSVVLLGRAEPSPTAANAFPGAESPVAPTVTAPASAPAPAALPATPITLATPVLSVPAAAPPPVKPEPRQFLPPPAQVAAGSAAVAVAPPDTEVPIVASNVPSTVAVELATASPVSLTPPSAESNPKLAGEVTTEPRAISRVMPVVPPDARNLKGSGLEVSVRVKIDPDGRVVEATVQDARTSAANFLGKLAVDAARQWRFEPARRGNRKIYSDMVLRFRF